MSVAFPERADTRKSCCGASQPCKTSFLDSPYPRCIGCWRSYPMMFPHRSRRQACRTDRFPKAGSVVVPPLLTRVFCRAPTHQRIPSPSMAPDSTLRTRSTPRRKTPHVLPKRRREDTSLHSESRTRGGMCFFRFHQFLVHFGPKYWDTLTPRTTGPKASHRFAPPAPAPQKMRRSQPCGRSASESPTGAIRGTSERSRQLHQVINTVEIGCPATSRPSDDRANRLQARNMSRSTLRCRAAVQAPCTSTRRPWASSCSRLHVLQLFDGTSW